MKLSPFDVGIICAYFLVVLGVGYYLKDKMRSAVWLIKSLDQRQRTIYKVADSIVRHQREFLDKGIEHLRPLVLRDVANDIGMHESTVSRVVSNKYIHTPRGLSSG